MSLRGRALVEAAGAVSIVASLVFVGFQMRQANTIARLQVLQEHAAQWREANLAMVADPGLLRVMAMAKTGAIHSDLASEDALALDLALDGLVHGWEGNFKQLQLGVLDEHDIIFPIPSSAFFGSQYAREWWKSARGAFDEDFAAFWEERFGLTNP